MGTENFGTKPTYEDVEKIANFLLSKTIHRPKIGIICGTGLGGLAETLTDAESLKYEDIPSFPISTVQSHEGKLVFGKINGRAIVCMKGRCHMYEGYSTSKITLPVRVMKLMGVEILIVTNACGGLNTNYKAGDVMIIKDHIDIPGMAGSNPLVGQNDEKFGKRTFAMSDAYDRELRLLAKKTVEEMRFDFFQEGVYAMQAGPCYETVTECRLLQQLGADVIGMSTVPEVVIARHCGIRVVGISLVTNMCILQYDADTKLYNEEVMETAKRRAKNMQSYVKKLVDKLPV